MSADWKQNLVNAQVGVNRAVFAFNARHNRRLHPYSMVEKEGLSDRYILGQINEAINDLFSAYINFRAGEFKE